MEIKWINNVNVMPTSEPLIAAIANDESHAVVGLVDEGIEHSAMLRKVLGTDKDIDQYFRIVFNQEGTDWIFVCPSNYAGIANKEQRIEVFYNDGYRIISNFLRGMGYPEIIEIPKRYKYEKRI